MTVELVLVPGMCSVGSAVYKDLVEQLKTTLPQVKVHVVDLVSVDGIATKAQLEPNGLVADINTIQSVIKRLIDNDSDVVVVAHSYGGTPSLYAADGLWTKQRSSPGGVKRVGLMSSSLSLPGGSVGGDREEWKQQNEGQITEPMPEMEQHGKETYLIPKGFEVAWMNDLPDNEELRGSLRPSPLSTVLSPTPEADVKQWDIAYLATTDLDLAMPEPFQKHLVDRARDHGANVEYETIRSGHFVQVSHAAEVAHWISKLV